MLTRRIFRLVILLLALSLQRFKLDNVSSHNSAMVNEWLKDRPDWTFHFTPTSASWMNAVEGFFSMLASQRLTHAIFDSIDKCIAAVEGCIERHNANGSCPFRWSRKSSRQSPQPTSSALGPDRNFLQSPTERAN